MLFDVTRKLQQQPPQPLQRQQQQQRATMVNWGDVLFKNAYGVDAAETEKSQREKYPLLLHKDEKVLMAWKDRGGMGRDKSMFTSHRILLKDGKGLTAKRKNYKSIPYWAIQAFSTETAGSLDGDVELKIYSKGIEYSSIDFSATKVNIFEIQQFLNAKLVEFALKGTQDKVDGTPPSLDAKDQKQSIIDFLGDNASQLEPKVVEDLLKTKYPVLLKHETVQIAFKSGRYVVWNCLFLILLSSFWEYFDSPSRSFHTHTHTHTHTYRDYTVFTDMRVMRVDVQGITGKRVEFFTVLWKSILAYSVQTAGAFIDRDMELVLYTNIIGVGRIEQDLRHGKCDLFTLQKILCNHILGEDTKPMEGLDTHAGEVDQKGFWWFRDDQRPMDVVEMNKVYHSNPAILRGNEVIEMAFKGHRDITILYVKTKVLLECVVSAIWVLLFSPLLRLLLLPAQTFASS